MKNKRVLIKKLLFVLPVYFALTGLLFHAEIAADEGKTELSLPADVYIAAGRTLNLWNDTLRPAWEKDVKIVFKSAVGESTKRGFCFTPDSSHEGKKFPVKVLVNDAEGNNLHEFSFALHAAPSKNGQGVLQLLFIGDSLTANGIMSGEVKRLAEADGGFQPMLLGRGGWDDNRHEGWGGWSFKSFTARGYSMYRFTVSGIKDIPRTGMGYRHDGAAYRMRTGRLFKDEEGLYCGTMDFLVRRKDNPELTATNRPQPGQTGVLKLYDILSKYRKDGIKADSEISFTKVDMVASNPFWDETLNEEKGGMNLRRYMKEENYFGGEDRIDFAFIQLGVNDCMGVAIAPEGETEKRLDEIFENCRNLIRGIHDPVYGYPECRIILALTPIGCNTPETYKGVIKRYESAVRSLWDRIIREFDNPSFRPLVRVSVNGLMTDRDEGFPKKEETIDGKTVLVHNNAVHPNEYGYRQCADAYYSVLRGWLADD